MEATEYELVDRIPLIPGQSTLSVSNESGRTETRDGADRTESGAKRLKKTRHLWSALTDIIAAVIPLAFMVYGVLVLQHEGDPVQDDTVASQLLVASKLVSSRAQSA